jgi:hypothetical protein
LVYCTNRNLAILYECPILLSRGKGPIIHIGLLNLANRCRSSTEGKEKKVDKLFM